METSDGERRLHHRHGTTATAPFEYRAPSPPIIHVPAALTDASKTILPSFDNDNLLHLSREDLEIITGGKAQLAVETMNDWRYDMRRKAQRILDFLWLGPWIAAKDADFLRREGITMLLAARNDKQAERALLSVPKRTARELGIVADHIDVASFQELIQAFPIAVEKINQHLLDVYRAQAVGPPRRNQENEAPGAPTPPPAPEEGSGRGEVIDPSSPQFKRGRVLVFCESGNDRSAALVAAYIMTVFGTDLVSTLQFINLQRFCTTFDEETKGWLRSYHDILLARRSVAKESREQQQWQLVNNTKNNNSINNNNGISVNPDQLAAAAPFSSIVNLNGGGGGGGGPRKRTISDTYDVMDHDGPEEEGEDESGEQDPEKLELQRLERSVGAAHDLERYLNRPHFVPFVDRNDTAMEDP